jgi:hypothetical protein
MSPAIADATARWAQSLKVLYRVFEPRIVLLSTSAADYLRALAVGALIASLQRAHMLAELIRAGTRIPHTLIRALMARPADVSNTEAFD